MPTEISALHKQDKRHRRQCQRDHVKSHQVIKLYPPTWMNLTRLFFGATLYYTFVSYSYPFLRSQVHEQDAILSMHSVLQLGTSRMIEHFVIQISPNRRDPSPCPRRILLLLHQSLVSTLELESNLEICLPSSFSSFLASSAGASAAGAPPAPAVGAAAAPPPAPTLRSMSFKFLPFSACAFAY